MEHTLLLRQPHLLCGFIHGDKSSIALPNVLHSITVEMPPGKVIILVFILSFVVIEAQRRREGKSPVADAIAGAGGYTRWANPEGRAVQY